MARVFQGALAASSCLSRIATATPDSSSRIKAARSAFICTILLRLDQKR